MLDETSVIASTTEQLREGHQVARPQHVEPFTRPEQLLRSNNDKVFIANASERLSRFSSRMVEDSETHETRIIPKIQMTNWLGDKVVLSAGIQLPEMSDSLGENFKTAVTQRFSANGLTISPQGLPIKATLKKDATSESKKVCDTISVAITDPSCNGGKKTFILTRVFLAILSFLSLLFQGWF